MLSQRSVHFPLLIVNHGDKPFIIAEFIGHMHGACLVEIHFALHNTDALAAAHIGWSHPSTIYRWL
jgi:hypothetical protein